MAVALLSLAACSGSKNLAMPTESNAVAPLTISSADFKQIAAWGSKGQQAVAQCPQGYRVVAGGSSSSDGTFVGTGFPDSTHSAWVVKPESGASGEAFASCLRASLARKTFRWVSATPASGLAAAQCRPNYMLVTGYGTGTVKTSWFNPATNTYWVGGGGTAYASCARLDSGIVIRHAWNQSQKPLNVFAGCGSGYTVIGGAMGDSAWPGPPIQEHPGIKAGPGHHGYAGWWTFSNAQNELTWAACVKT
jgi:hypothetical protein